MLGRYSPSGLGASARDILGTTARTQETIEEIIPTVKNIADDYDKMRPGVQFLTKYWYTVLIILALASAGGSGLGSWFVLKRLKK
jgi:hypothetical protein